MNRTTWAGTALLLAATLLVAAPVPAQVLDDRGLRVRSVVVEGLDGTLAPEHLPPLPLAPGSPYTLGRLQQAEYRIVRTLAELGHAAAVVETTADIPPGERWADLRLRVEPGPRMVFDTVLVDVESPLTEAEVRRRLLIRSGEPVSPAAIERSVQRLQRLAIVDGVRADATGIPGQEDRLVTRIAVSTHPAQGPGLAGAFSSARCLEGRVGWASRHFLGAPRTFSVSAGGANLLARPLRRFPCTGVGEGEFADADYFFRSEVGEPIGAATWLFVSGEASRITAARAYIRRGVQARVAVAHELGGGWDGVLGYQPERSDNPGAAPLLCAIYGICVAQELGAATAATVHAPLEAAIAWASPPVTGVIGAAPTAPLWMQPVRAPWRLALRTVITTAGAATLSRYTYGSAVVDGSAARSLGPRAELAARVRIGALVEVGEHVPPQARLFGGGPAGVRGVAPNLLGPKILTMTRAAAEALEDGVLIDGEPIDPRQVRPRPTGGDLLVESSLELRFRAAGWLDLAAFADYGVGRARGSAHAPLSGTRTEAVVTPGIGALLLLPVGPLRVDVAYDTSPARRYPLLVPGEDGSQELRGNVLYDPVGFDSPTGSREFRRRLQLQLSMGHPF